MYLDNLGPIFLPDPLNAHHPLNTGRVVWYLAVPGLEGASRFYNLCTKYIGALTGMTSGTSGWAGTTRPGGWGQLNYDGTDDRVNLSTMPTAPFLTEYTVAAWVKTATISGNHGIFASRNTRVQWQLDSNGADARMIVTDDGVAHTMTATYTSAFSVGPWFRVVGVRSGNNVAIYVNGLAGGTGTTSMGTEAGSASAKNIGSVDGGSAFWNGAIDDVSAWSRALTVNEVLADYELSRLGYPGVLNRWKPTYYAVPTVVSLPKGSLALLGVGF